VWIGEPAASGPTPAKVRVEILDRATAAKSCSDMELKNGTSFNRA